MSASPPAQSARRSKTTRANGSVHFASDLTLHALSLLPAFLGLVSFCALQVGQRAVEMVGLSPSGHIAPAKQTMVTRAIRPPKLPPTRNRPIGTIGKKNMLSIALTVGGTPKRLSKPTVTFFAQEEQYLLST